MPIPDWEARWRAVSAPGICMKILIVDSDHHYTKVLTSILTAEGFQVASVGSGTKAIHAMLAAAPSLVILASGLIEEDPFASAWDCFALSAWIRHTLSSANVSMIVHSADRSDTFIARVRESGVPLIRKNPDDFTELLTAVRCSVIGQTEAA